MDVETYKRAKKYTDKQIQKAGGWTDGTIQESVNAAISKNTQVAGLASEIEQQSREIEELKQNGVGGVSQEQLEQTVKNEIAKVDFDTVKSPIYDTSGFSKSSIDIAHEMLIGWNMGDSLDSFNARSWLYTTPNDMQDKPLFMETLWGNVDIKREFIEYLAKIGIQAVRLPVTWLEFVDEKYNNLVDQRYLARVRQVVEWIIENGMYVIVNMHHDGVSSQKSRKRLILAEDYAGGFTYMEDSKAYACNVWRQVADYMKDIGYKLIFETFNEVCNQYGNMSPSDLKNSMATELNIAIVKAIRRTGGNNKNRFIACNSYGGVSYLPSKFIEQIQDVDTATDKILSCSHEYPTGKVTAIWNLGECTKATYGSYLGEINWESKNHNRAELLADLRTKSNDYKFPVFYWDSGCKYSSLINRLHCTSSRHDELESYLGHSLDEKYIFDKSEFPLDIEPYYSIFENPNYENDTWFGWRYVMICSSKKIKKVEQATTTISAGYYKITGMENGYITFYHSQDGISYERDMSRLATTFMEVRDDIHILGSDEKTYLVESNYTIIDAPQKIIECTNLTLDNSNIIFTTKDSQTIIATKEPSDCTQTVTWTSDNTDVATVVDGVITPKSQGTCVITATCGSQTATCSIDTSSVEFNNTDTPDITTAFEWNGEDTLPNNMTIPSEYSIKKSNEYGTYITSNTQYSKGGRMLAIKESDGNICLLNSGEYIEAEFVLLDDLTTGTTNTRPYCGLVIAKSVSKAWEYLISGNGTNTNLKTLANIDEVIGTRFTIRITRLISNNNYQNIEIINADGETVYSSQISLYTNGGLGVDLGVYVNSSVGITRTKVVKNS